MTRRIGSVGIFGAVISLLNFESDKKEEEKNLLRTFMTYGEMPTREVFNRHYDAACPTNSFSFENDKRVGTCSLSQEELWNELAQAHYAFYNADSEGAGEWCSLVLGVLGIEWI